MEERPDIVVVGGAPAERSGLVATLAAAGLASRAEAALALDPPEQLPSRPAPGGRRTPHAPDNTHVRWVLNGPLDVGSTGIARFRAVPR